jgi:Family of unknown function (DUF5996)
MDAQEVAVGWWPSDARYPQAAFYAYAHPAPEGFETAALTPETARWGGGARRVLAGLGRCLRGASSANRSGHSCATWSCWPRHDEQGGELAQIREVGLAVAIEQQRGARVR